MKLPINFFNKNKREEDSYLGLFLKEQEGIAMFLDFRGDELKIIAQEKFTYTNAWENLTEDIDEALYKLELQTKKSPEKTIFFVYSHLVDNTAKQIGKPYLHKIKEIVKNLELKPLGYIECHEAVVDHLEKKEEIALTANLIEIDKTSLAIFVYKGGKLIFQEAVSRTSDIIQDLIPVFDKIKNQTLLPTRIVLYNSRDLDLEVANILTHRWEKDYFIQLPRVDVVKESQLIESLLRVFSKQILSPFPQAVKGDLSQDKEVMGFVIGGDVKREERESIPVQAGQRKWKLPALPSLSFLFTPLLTKLKQLKITMPSLLVLGVILTVVGLTLFEYYFHKANVTIFFPSQNIDKNILVDAYTKQVKAKNSLLLKTAAETVNFDKNKSTSGKREVGEKAKGKVTIYNKNSNKQTLDAGTKITTTNNLVFTLDSSVTIASAESDITTTKAGTADISVSAQQIGSESNLPAGTTFSINSLSDIAAKNGDSFSGGTKKEVRTVSQADVDSLRNQILQETNKYLTNKLEPRLGKDSKLLKAVSQTQLSKLDYSKEIGEEANNLELKAEARISYFYYKNKDILSVFKKDLEKNIQEGLSIEEENIKYEIPKVDQEKEKYILEAAVKAKATPTMDKQILLKEIRGKRAKNIENSIKKKTKALGLEYEIGHPLPFMRGWLPFFAKNIQLKVSFP